MANEIDYAATQKKKRQRLIEELNESHERIKAWPEWKRNQASLLFKDIKERSAQRQQGNQIGDQSE